jgi:hypothetical protein
MIGSEELKRFIHVFAGDILVLFAAPCQWSCSRRSGGRPNMEGSLRSSRGRGATRLRAMSGRRRGRRGANWPVLLTYPWLTSIFCSNLRTRFDFSNYGRQRGQPVLRTCHWLAPETALSALSAAFVARPATAASPVAATLTRETAAPQPLTGLTLHSRPGAAAPGAPVRPPATKGEPHLGGPAEQRHPPVPRGQLPRLRGRRPGLQPPAHGRQARPHPCRLAPPSGQGAGREAGAHDALPDPVAITSLSRSLFSRSTSSIICRKQTWNPAGSGLGFPADDPHAWDTTSRVSDRMAST